MTKMQKGADGRPTHTSFISRSEGLRSPQHIESARHRVEVNSKTDEMTQHIEMMSHRKACIDLEKATKFITEVLQHEVVRNRELCMLICRLEEKEVETGRSLMEQAESNKQLWLEISALKKQLKAKDNALSEANQTVAFLKNELKDLHQQQQMNHWYTHTYTHTPADQLTPAQESLVWSEPLVSPDAQSPLVSSAGQRIVEALVSGVKEEYSADAGGYEESHHSVEAVDPKSELTFSAAAEAVDPKSELTFSSAADIKTEIIQGDEEMSTVAPVFSSESDQSSPDPASLAQLRGVSVVLVDCCRTQEQQGKDDENLRDGEEPKNRNGSSLSSSAIAAFPSISETPTPEMDRSKPSSCSVRGQTFPSQSPLRRPPHVHKRKRPLSCPQCGKTFLHAATLHAHQRVHTGRSHHCTYCPRNFLSEWDLKRHRRIHTGERPYHCAQCGKSFTRKDNLQSHQRIHLEERTYLCSHCGKGFTREDYLKKHQRIHTG
ncbi:zinc finger protein 354C-like isoform X3 [Alosa alosa]|uniref:zinc finger protein 354C-like isoform X3 n=1 Tax=Alosa alosa TaxID=278164 RepID=UPI0020150BDB|nr:zinc finger protein 354C-like isoform X3 [Alosa alosa]